MIYIDSKSKQFLERVEKHKEHMEKRLLPRYISNYKCFSRKQRAFFSELLGSSDAAAAKKLLEYCISPELCEIAAEFEKIYFTHFNASFKEEVQKHKKSKTTGEKQISKIVNSILGYENFNVRGADWNRHSFITSLNVNVCPYCNRNYITSYEDKDLGSVTTADADHYYPKSLYPILQMNIYNLIPSCGVCNSRMKGDKDIRHLYPYTDSSNCLKFKINYERIETLYAFSKSNINILLEPINETNKANASIELFKLNKVYQVHNNIGLELIKKIYHYEAFQNTYYNKLLGDSLADELFAGADLKEFWFEFLSKDATDEPLVKMKQDIYRQFV